MSRIGEDLRSEAAPGLCEQGILTSLFAWFSPAFPIGSFAYSHGLEAIVAQDLIGEESGFGNWLEDVLNHGTGWSDAVLLAMAYGALDEETLVDVCDLASALAPSRERWIETLDQGEAFMNAVRTGWPGSAPSALATRVAHPVAAGVIGARIGAPLETLLIAYLSGFSSNLIGAGVRLSLCGQSGGVRILARLGPVITTIARRARSATEIDLGGCALASDIASMRHEVQTTRMFVT